MANAKRGLIDIELGGEIHQLRFPNSVMRQLQERLKVQTPLGVWEKMTSWTTDDWQHVLCLGLQKGSDPNITLEEVDDLILGTETLYYIAVLSETINAAIKGEGVSEQTRSLVDKVTKKTMQEAAEPGASGREEANP